MGRLALVVDPYPDHRQHLVDALLQRLKPAGITDVAGGVECSDDEGEEPMAGPVVHLTVDERSREPMALGVLRERVADADDLQQPADLPAL